MYRCVQKHAIPSYSRGRQNERGLLKIPKRTYKIPKQIHKIPKGTSELPKTNNEGDLRTAETDQTYLNGLNNTEICQNGPKQIPKPQYGVDDRMPQISVSNRSKILIGYRSIRATLFSCYIDQWSVSAFFRYPANMPRSAIQGSDLHS